MKKRTIFITFLYFIIFFNIEVDGQSSFSVALLNEQISFPFTRIAPVHPGLEVGTTIYQQSSGKNKTALNAYLGGYHHASVANALFLRGDLQYSRKIVKQFNLDCMFGAGYLYSTYPGPMFKQNRTGTFVEVKKKGKSHAIMNTGVGTSWHRWQRLSPFIKYELIVEMPFANGIPFVPHTVLKAGITYKL